MLKALTIVLTQAWTDRLSHRCFHVAGRGGAKAAVRQVSEAAHQELPFVFRSDVKKYHDSIDHDILMESPCAAIGSIRRAVLFRVVVANRSSKIRLKPHRKLSVVMLNDGSWRPRAFAFQFARLAEKQINGS